MGSIFRKVLSWILFGVVGAILLTVAAQWFVEVAEDKGVYDMAGQRWDMLLDSAESIAVSAWVLFPVTALAGFVGGLWADNLWKHWTRKKRLTPNFATELGLQMQNLENAISKSLQILSYNYDHAEFARLYVEVQSLGITTEKVGLSFPMLDISPDIPLENLDTLRIYSTYLTMVGALLRGGHIAEAGNTASGLTADVVSGHLYSQLSPNRPSGTPQ